jgi:hypothetical protein
MISPTIQLSREQKFRCNRFSLFILADAPPTNVSFLIDAQYSSIFVTLMVMAMLPKVSHYHTLHVQCMTNQHVL